MDELGVSVRRLTGEASGNVELKGAGGVAWVDPGGVVEHPSDDFGGAQFSPSSPYAVDDLAA